MWTASITKVEQDPTPNVASVTFQYDNDDGRKPIIVVERISDPKTIKQMAFNGVTALTNADDIADLIANPSLGPVDLTPQPTQDQLDQATYQQQRAALIQAKQDLDIGLLTQEDFDSQLSTVQTIKSNIVVKTQLKP